MFQTLRHLISTENEYAELVGANNTEEAGKTPIFVDALNNFADSERILKRCREGAVVFARIGQFKNTNITELKRTLGRIKTVTTAMGGQLASVGDEWIVLAPSNGTIAR